MRLVWLVEAGVYGDEARPLLAEIRRQGMAAEFVAHSALCKGAPVSVAGRQLERGDCVIGYGTFPFARQIQLHCPWSPGAWCSPENLDCATYYAHFGHFLLNQRYTLLPGVEAIRLRDWVFSVLAEEDAVFARPAGCHKLFTGRLIPRESFADALSPTRYDPATLVVIAAPRPIDREWRLVVADGRVIAASQYAQEGERAISRGCPDEVFAFAERMLAEVRWRPDPVFMLDVCESDGDLRLVELNGFSCSWLYACDPAPVVAAVSALAGQTVR
jgi:hypothetical protein